jgi:hypothetical protein
MFIEIGYEFIMRPHRGRISIVQCFSYKHLTSSRSYNLIHFLSIQINIPLYIQSQISLKNLHILP